VAAAPTSKPMTKAAKTAWSLFCMPFFGLRFYFMALEECSIRFRASYAADEIADEVVGVKVLCESNGGDTWSPTSATSLTHRKPR